MSNRDIAAALRIIANKAAPATATAILHWVNELEKPSEYPGPWDFDGVFVFRPDKGITLKVLVSNDNRTTAMEVSQLLNKSDVPIIKEAQYNEEEEELCAVGDGHDDK